MLQLQMLKKRKLKALMQASKRMIIAIGDWSVKVGNKAEPSVSGKKLAWGGPEMKQENYSESSVKPTTCLSQIPYFFMYKIPHV